MNARANWLAGLGLGAGLVYFLDPQGGNRRRARVRDKLTHAAHEAGDAARTTSRDLTQRLQGVAAEARARLTREEVEDARLVERVRAKLGRHVSHPRAIDAEARDGRVTLRGPILEREARRLVAAVRRVRGVREIADELERHATADGVPALQGGSPPPGDRPDVMQRHWAPATRLVVGGAGALLAMNGTMRRGPLGLLVAASGVGLLARALSNLEVKRLTGIGGGRRAVDLQKTVTIDAPVSEVFRYWAHFQNFPQFMAHVREVRPTAVSGQSHWVLSGPIAAPIEFDAVLTEFVPDKVLAWKTTAGAPVAHAGIVRFDPTEAGGTRLQIRMSYNPPAGALGHALAVLLGVDPKSRMDDDLVRMKTFVETGRPPHDAASNPAAASGPTRG